MNHFFTRPQILPCEILDYSISHTMRNQPYRFRIAGFTPPAGTLASRSALRRNKAYMDFDLTTTAAWLHLQLTNSGSRADV